MNAIPKKAKYKPKIFNLNEARSSIAIIEHRRIASFQDEAISIRN